MQMHHLPNKLHVGKEVVSAATERRTLFHQLLP